VIVVKIELWPNGMVTRAREIGRVFIHNATNGLEASDYFVKTEEEAAPHLGIRASFQEFMVRDHDRNDSVFKLLSKVFAYFSEPTKTIN
jgi:hypothetical protein